MLKNTVTYFINIWQFSNIMHERFEEGTFVNILMRLLHTVNPNMTKDFIVLYFLVAHRRNILITM